MWIIRATRQGRIFSPYWGRNLEWVADMEDARQYPTHEAALAEADRMGLIGGYVAHAVKLIDNGQDFHLDAHAPGLPRHDTPPVDGYYWTKSRSVPGYPWTVVRASVDGLVFGPVVASTYVKDNGAYHLSDCDGFYGPLLPPRMDASPRRPAPPPERQCPLCKSSNVIHQPGFGKGLDHNVCVRCSHEWHGSPNPGTAPAPPPEAVPVPTAEPGPK